MPMRFICCALFAFALALAFVSPCAAADGDALEPPTTAPAKQALKKHDYQIEQARKKYRQAVEAAKKACVTELQTYQARLRKGGNNDAEVDRIRATIEQLEAELAELRFEGETLDDGPLATVRVWPTPEFKPLADGVPQWGDEDKYVWDDIPAKWRNRRFTQHPGKHQGWLKFEVVKSGWVIVGFAEGPGAVYDEGSSGPGLEAAGWKPMPEHDLRDRRGFVWQFYRRKCEAGENIELRNRKYEAPIIVM